MSKILVVDDDLDILVVMEILLNMKGYKVEVLSRWEKTYDKINEFHPDLILLDVLISGKDGRDLCKEIKANPSSGNIPIIMFSAHPGAAATIAEYGADDFISKPFDVKDLMTKLTRHLKSD